MIIDSRAPTRIDLADRMGDVAVERLELGVERGKVVEGRDRLVELHSIQRVVDRCLQAVPGRTQGAEDDADEFFHGFVKKFAPINLMAVVLKLMPT